MKPTMQFRWLVRRNQMPTAVEVISRSEREGCSKMEAKRRLLDVKPAVLQQWWEVEGHEHDDYLKAGGEWQDVPTEYEPNAK